MAVVTTYLNDRSQGKNQKLMKLEVPGKKTTMFPNRNAKKIFQMLVNLF
jgi:hypothetical protein